MDSDLSCGQHYPPFEQPGPELDVSFLVDFDIHCNLTFFTCLMHLCTMASCNMSYLASSPGKTTKNNKSRASHNVHVITYQSEYIPQNILHPW